MTTAWQVEVCWEEELWYREGNQSFCFDCDWKVEPYQAFVPGEATWDKVLPEWLRGRRSEVLDRLRQANDHHGHQLVDDDFGYHRRRRGR